MYHSYPEVICSQREGEMTALLTFHVNSVLIQRSKTLTFRNRVGISSPTCKMHGEGKTF